MPCTARVCMPQTMALVCLLKSVVALAEGTRGQGEMRAGSRNKHINKRGCWGGTDSWKQQEC